MTNSKSKAANLQLIAIYIDLTCEKSQDDVVKNFKGIHGMLENS